MITIENWEKIRENRIIGQVRHPRDIRIVITPPVLAISRNFQLALTERGRIYRLGKPNEVYHEANQESVVAACQHIFAQVQVFANLLLVGKTTVSAPVDRDSAHLCSPNHLPHWHGAVGNPALPCPGRPDGTLCAIPYPV